MDRKSDFCGWLLFKLYSFWLCTDWINTGEIGRVNWTSFFCFSKLGIYRSRTENSSGKNQEVLEEKYRNLFSTQLASEEFLHFVKLTTICGTQFCSGFVNFFTFCQ